MTQTVIGVDVGGSGIRAARVGRDGTLVGEVLRRPHRSLDAAGITQQITGLVDEVAAGRSVDGIGLGIPAFLSEPDGVVSLSPNLPQLNGWAVVQALQAALGLADGVSLVVANDANAAAFGEAWAGAGRGYDPLIFLGLGTGVGGGVVLGGKLLTGRNGMAAELGHLTVFPDGSVCGCGGRGCLEAHASANAIVTAFEQMVEALPVAQQGRYADTLTAEDVARHATAGDVLCRGCFASAGCALGLAASQLVHVFNPARIVIGGQMAAAWDLFWPSLWQTLQQHTPKILRDGLDLVPAALGPEAGIVGAAGLAWKRLNPA